VMGTNSFNRYVHRYRYRFIFSNDHYKRPFSEICIYRPTGTVRDVFNCRANLPVLVCIFSSTCFPVPVFVLYAYSTFQNVLELLSGSDFLKVGLPKAVLTEKAKIGIWKGSGKDLGPDLCPDLTQI
jgi:hypothetical protein